MDYIIFIVVCLSMGSALGNKNRISKERLQKPNIVVIVADDLGWNDIGWNNPDIHTPNLNDLAKNGIRLENHYATPLCSPSRAALMTGYYPFRLGMQHGVLKKNKPHGLPLNHTTLPERLRRLGYATHIIGKWHLGFCSWPHTPTFRGFDSFYGFYSGHIDYFTHRSGKEKGIDFRLNTKAIKMRGKYSTQLFNKRARKLIEHHDKNIPLFLYLPFQAPHAPLQPPKKNLELYKEVNNKDRKYFSALVTSLDDSVGYIMSALKRRNMHKNTLVVFMSDNGGTPFSGGSNWPLRGAKSTLWEGGTRVPAFAWGKMLNTTNYLNKELFHIIDWVPTLVSAAEGEVADDIDGISQWDMLTKGDFSKPRKEFIYGINEVAGRAAIRKGKYKLVEGSAGPFDDWYIPTLNENKVKKGWESRNLNNTMLFNLDVDPSETTDLSLKLPHVVQTLHERLEIQRGKLVPAYNPKKLKKSHPKFWGGFWSPGWC